MDAALFAEALVVLAGSARMVRRAWPRARSESAARVFLVLGAAFAFVGGGMLRAALQA